MSARLILSKLKSYRIIKVIKIYYFKMSLIFIFKRQLAVNKSSIIANKPKSTSKYEFKVLKDLIEEENRLRQIS
jgi:hypothetical protein